MRLNFVLGTAAELIKIYPLIEKARERGWDVRILSTGQARENFQMQYRDFRLPEELLHPLLESAGDLDQSSKALKWFLRSLCISKRTLRSKFLLGSDALAVVHGDTLSTLSGAWNARRAGLKVVHVEAGLRSPRLFNPFPEEITRRLVTRLAHWHMAPDAHAAANLKAAGAHGQIVNSEGNTLEDAVSAIPERSESFGGGSVLVNVHRFENLNSPVRWRKIVATVLKAAQSRRVLFVTHPQTQHRLNQDRETRENFTRAGVEILDRIPFSDFIARLKAADFLISDGGSNQEECSYLGKPCLLLRESTERQEGLDGCCVLSRFEDRVIQDFLDHPEKFARKASISTQSPSDSILNALAKNNV